MNEVCRICLLRDVELKDIFLDNIFQNIISLTSVKIDYQDGLPQFICNSCLDELNVAINFKNKCEESYVKLCDYYRNVSVSPHSSVQESNVETFEEYYTNDVKTDINSCKIIQDNAYRIISREGIIEERTELINVVECLTCSKQEVSFPKFQEHKCDLNDPCDTFYTNICSKNLAAEEYNAHLKIHEEGKLKPQENNEINKSADIKKKKVQQCELCGKITQYRSELIRHMRLHSGERPFKCGLCSKTFRCKEFLSKHSLTHTGKREHHCLYCPKSFIIKSNLTQHTRLHTDERKYSCNICNKKFKAARTLRNHIKIHTGERNYPCNLCEKAFVNPFDLRRHIKLHEKYKAISEGTYDMSKEPPKQLHQCEHCGKFVPSRGDLTKHMRVHTKERPFKCQLCGKAFSGTSALAVHNRTHTGTKPYNCVHCGASFTQSSNLKVHVRLHTGIRPYSCSICNKGFNRNRDLITHLRKHATEKV